MCSQESTHVTAHRHRFRVGGRLSTPIHPVPYVGALGIRLHPCRSVLGMLGPATVWLGRHRYGKTPLFACRNLTPQRAPPWEGLGCGHTTPVIALAPSSLPRHATTLTLPCLARVNSLPSPSSPSSSSPSSCCRAFPQQTVPCASRPSSSTRSRRGRSSPRTSAPYVLSPRNDTLTSNINRPA